MPTYVCSFLFCVFLHSLHGSSHLPIPVYWWVANASANCRKRSLIGIKRPLTGCKWYAWWQKHNVNNLPKVGIWKWNSHLWSRSSHNVTWWWIKISHFYDRSHCSRLLLRAGRAAIDLYLVAAWPRAANSPQRRAAAEWWDRQTDRRTDGRPTVS